MRSIVTAATLVLSLSLFAVHAQSAFSVEAGFLTAFEEAVFLVGIRSTAAKAGAAGVDFSLSTLPQLIPDGVFMLMPNLDLTTSAPVGPRAWLLPRFGVSALTAVGEGGGGGVLGLNIGIGLLGRFAERAGTRIDVTYVRYFSGGESVGFTALTFGLAWVR